MILPDLLRPGLALVLCGSAPSRASKEAAAYYAHPGNGFWSTLHAVGLTPRRLAPEEYPALLDHGIGLTDLNKSDWGADSELSRTGFDRAGFVAKMRRHRPGLIAFNSKYAASHYFGTHRISYGLQEESLDGIPLLVVPSTSGRARGSFDPAPWQDLACRVRAVVAARIRNGVQGPCL